MPDEAESAEAGAVTSEAAWAVESGAAAGNGSGPPSLSPRSPNGPACPPRRGPVDPSEPWRGVGTHSGEAGTERSTRGRSRG